MTRLTRWCLGAGAALAAGVALLHLALPFAPPSAYAYFGAPQLAVAEGAGARWPDALTVGLAVVFGGWSYYALAALGAVRRPPLLAWGLAAVGAVCTLRGLALAPELVLAARGAVPPRHLAFSAVALAIGLAYAAGAWRLWPALRAPAAGDR